MRNRNSTGEHLLSLEMQEWGKFNYSISDSHTAVDDALALPEEKKIVKFSKSC